MALFALLVAFLILFVLAAVAFVPNGQKVSTPIRMGTFSFGQAASSHQFLLDVGMAGTLVASVTPIHSLGACSG